MPSHMSSIGFPVSSREEFRDLVLKAAREGEPIEARGGSYVRWSPGSGVELWAQVTRSGEVVGMNPHYSGGATTRVGLTSRVVRKEHSPDGGFYGWASPGDQDPDSGWYPFVFDAPDYELHRDLQLPAIREVQLAAFAHEIRAYRSDEEYEEARLRGDRGSGLAAEAFIPSGLFKPGGEAIKPPQAHAVLAGHVLEARLLRNPVTEVSFQWARVRTYGAEVDVVAAPEAIEGRLVEGGVLSGSFWLSGCIRK